MQVMGKALVLVGVVLAMLGLALMFSDKIPFLGKLPGDISIRRENFEFHFPVMTSIVLSVVITLVLWIIAWLRGKN